MNFQTKDRALNSNWRYDTGIYFESYIVKYVKRQRWELLKLHVLKPQELIPSINWVKKKPSNKTWPFWEINLEEVCQVLLLMHVKYYRKMYLLKMCGPHIWLCLFTTRCVETDSLTTIHTLSWLGGAVVTYPLWMQEVPGSIPGSDKVFYVWFFVLMLLCLYFLSRNTLVVTQICNSFYLIYLTYWKICDQL